VKARSVTLNGAGVSPADIPMIIPIGAINVKTKRMIRSCLLTNLALVKAQPRERLIVLELIRRAKNF